MNATRGCANDVPVPDGGATARHPESGNGRSGSRSQSRRSDDDDDRRGDRDAWDEERGRFASDRWDEERGRLDRDDDRFRRSSRHGRYSDY